jgi:mono/diheme cytochrome c family protein
MMTRVFASALAVALLPGFGMTKWLQAGGAAGAVGQDAARIELGMQVYEAQRCALCHSVADQGNKKGPLDGVGDRLSADEIEQWIVNPTEMAAKTNAKRKPPMKVYSNLPEEDLEALVSYMLSVTSN